MSMVRTKFFRLLQYMIGFRMADERELSFLSQPLELVIACDNDWSSHLCYSLPSADAVAGIALNIDFFHDLYGNQFDLNQVPQSKHINLVRYQVAYGGLLAELRWRWGDIAIHDTGWAQNCDTDIAWEIFSFGIMAKMVELDCPDNLFVALCRKWFSLSLFNFDSASYDGDIYIAGNHYHNSSMYRLYQRWVNGTKPLSDPKKSINRLPIDIKNGIMALRAIGKMREQYKKLQCFLTETDILESIDFYQLEQSLLRDTKIQQLEEENQKLRNILLTSRTVTTDGQEKYLQEMAAIFFPVISLGKAAKVLSTKNIEFTFTGKRGTGDTTIKCTFYEAALKKYLQRKAKGKKHIIVNKRTFYPIDLIVIILNDYKAIDIDCRQHYEFNNKFKSILAKKALSKDYFENIRQHYKWSE